MVANMMYIYGPDNRPTDQVLPGTSPKKLYEAGQLTDSE